MPREGRRRKPWRLVAAFGGAVLAVGAPVLAALAVRGEAGNPLNLALEGLASTSSGLVRDLRSVLPMGFAFAAGMASALNPCAFFLLPAYLSLSVHHGEPLPFRSRAVSVVVAALVVAVAFVVLFATVGLVVGVSASVVIGAFPIVALAVGLGLIVAASYRVADGAIHTRAGQVLAARLAPGQRSGLPRFFVFGLAFGAASLSCTLPVFLAVVGSAMTSGGILGSARDLTLYGLGMATVVGGLTLSLALVQSTSLASVRRLGRFVDPLGTVMLYAAGSYVIFYWLTLGGLLTARS